LIAELHDPETDPEEESRRVEAAAVHAHE
jgi:hypothetical protein